MDIPAFRDDADEPLVPEAETADENAGEAAPADDPETIASQLAAMGVDPGLVDSVRSGMMRQSDYTRKTQDISKVVENAQRIAQERDWLFEQFKNGRTAGAEVAAPQGSPAGPAGQSMIEDFLARTGDEIDTPELREFLGQFGEVVARQALAQAGEAFKPALVASRDAEFQRVMTNFHDQLSPKYSGLDKIWPQITAKVKEGLDAGQVHNPETLLWDLYPEQAAAARAAAVSQNKRQGTASSMEGFVDTRRMAPPAAPGHDTKQEVDMSASAIAKRVAAQLAAQRK